MSSEINIKIIIMVLFYFFIVTIITVVVFVIIIIIIIIITIILFLLLLLLLLLGEASFHLCGLDHHHGSADCQELADLQDIQQLHAEFQSMQ